MLYFTLLHFPASNYLSICRRRLGFSWGFCAFCHDNSSAQAEWAGKRTRAAWCKDEENAWEQRLASSFTDRALYMDSRWCLGLHPFFAWYVTLLAWMLCYVHPQLWHSRLEKLCVHLLLKCDLLPLTCPQNDYALLHALKRVKNGLTSPAIALVPSRWIVRCSLLCPDLWGQESESDTSPLLLVYFLIIFLFISSADSFRNWNRKDHIFCAYIFES